MDLYVIFKHVQLCLVYSGIFGLVLLVQVAFKTGEYKQQVIFIGGLTDGFLATQYASNLDSILCINALFTC